MAELDRVEIFLITEYYTEEYNVYCMTNITIKTWSKVVNMIRVDRRLLE